MSNMNKVFKKYPEVLIILERYEDIIRQRAEHELSYQSSEETIGREALQAYYAVVLQRDPESTDDECDDVWDEIVAEASRLPSLRYAFETVVYETLRDARIWGYFKYELNIEKTVTQYYAPLMHELTAKYAEQSKDVVVNALLNWSKISFDEADETASS